MSTTTGDSEQTERSSGSRIAVIDKAVAVLDALLPIPAGLTPTDVATAIGSNRSTAFRLLTSLEQAGLLFRESETGRYRLGMKLLQYGESVRAGTGIVDISEPILRNLSAGTRQSSVLFIREGFGARCVYRIPGPEIEVFAWRVGDWLPMHRGAGPQALLGGLPDAEVDLFLAQHKDLQTPHGLLSEQDVREQVAKTRRQGWFLNKDGLTPGVNSLAAAIPNSAGTPIYAISVAGLDHHYRGAGLKQIVEAVTTAAAKIAQQLS